MSQTELRKLWESRIADQQSSGLSASKWCKAHQVTPRQFSYWLKKLTGETPTSPRWVVVNVDSDSAETAVAKPAEKQPTLLLKVGSVEIEVKSGFDQTLLSDVVRTLQTLC